MQLLYILFPPTRIPVLLFKSACLLENFHQPLRAELITASFVFTYHLKNTHTSLYLYLHSALELLVCLSPSLDYELPKVQNVAWHINDTGQFIFLHCVNK